VASPPSQQLRDLVVSAAWRQHDSLAEFASILREHDAGLFYRSASLVDELFTDDRIQGVSETRIGELLSSPRKIKAASDKRKALKIAEEIGGEDGDGHGEGIWETICSPATAATMLKWGIYLGVAIAQIVWVRTPEKWTPRLVPWHPANLRWDDWQKVFILNTMGGQVVLPRPDEQPEGDGKWVVWCPNGVQYGWRDGLIRSLGEVYLSRRDAKRDFNRWTETRALGILKGKTPSGASDDAKSAFRADLANAAADTVVIVPQGADANTPGYDVEGVNLDSSGGSSWQGIKGLIDDANADISVLILGGNLPTEVSGDGSYAASKTQKQTSVNRALRDATLGPTIGRQVLTHWAEANYGDATLAPIPCYEVTPEEDELREAQAESAEATALKTKAEAIALLRDLEPHVDVAAMVEAEGLPLLSDEELAARLEEENQRAADAMAKMKEANGGADPDADPDTEDQQQLENPPARAALGMLESVRKRLTFQGLDVAVENPAGTIRQWNDGERSGHTVMRHHYGFLDGYMGADKEELDVYVGDFEAAEEVYVIHQRGKLASGRWGYDEDKCFMGFPSAEAAKAAFLAHRDDGDRAFGGMKILTLDQFKAKLRRRGSATTKLSAVAEVGRGLVALAARAGRAAPAGRRAAGSRRAAKYTAAVVEMGKKRAARALAPDLAALKSIVDSCENLSELKPRILKAFRGMDPTALARVVQKANILANLAGRSRALEEV
jgi:hypothetical protein